MCEDTIVKGASVNVPIVARLSLGECIRLFLCKLGLLAVNVCACAHLLAPTVSHSFFKIASRLRLSAEMGK